MLTPIVKNTLPAGSAKVDSYPLVRSTTNSEFVQYHEHVHYYLFRGTSIGNAIGILAQLESCCNDAELVTKAINICNSLCMAWSELNEGLASYIAGKKSLRRSLNEDEYILIKKGLPPPYLRKLEEIEFIFNNLLVDDFSKDVLAFQCIILCFNVKIYDQLSNPERWDEIREIASADEFNNRFQVIKEYLLSDSGIISIKKWEDHVINLDWDDEKKAQENNLAEADLFNRIIANNIKNLNYIPTNEIPNSIRAAEKINLFLFNKKINTEKKIIITSDGYINPSKGTVYLPPAPRISNIVELHLPFEIILSGKYNPNLFFFITHHWHAGDSFSISNKYQRTCLDGDLYIRVDLIEFASSKPKFIGSYFAHGTIQEALKKLNNSRIPSQNSFHTQSDPSKELLSEPFMQSVDSRADGFRFRIAWNKPQQIIKDEIQGLLMQNCHWALFKEDGYVFQILVAQEKDTNMFMLFPIPIELLESFGEQLHKKLSNKSFSHEISRKIAMACHHQLNYGF